MSVPLAPRRSPPGLLPPAGWWRIREVQVGTLYFALHLLAHFSASYFEVTPGVSLWYPPAGLAMSLLVLLGPRFAPLVFVANVVGASCTTDFGPNWGIVTFPTLITGVYSAVAFLARRWIGPRLLPGRPQQTAVFVLATLVAPACVAGCGMALVAQMEPLTIEALLRGFTQWWLGDASGMLTIVPLVMVFAGPWVRGEPRPAGTSVHDRHWLFFAGLRTLALLGSLWFVFAITTLPHTLTFYLCILPLVWICLRHGLPGATLATLVITMGGLLGMRLVDRTLESATAFLSLELVCVVVGLGLGSSVSRRNAAERQLAANEALLDRVISGAQVGLWDWDLRTNHATCNRLCLEMLGLPSTALAFSPAAWKQQIHPDDHSRIDTELQRHLEGRSALFECEYRLRSVAGGAERWIHVRGSVVDHDDRGRPCRLSGTKVDVTARKQAEAEAGRLLQILEATTDFVLITDSDGRILHANGALLHFIGSADLSGIRGQLLRTVLPEPSAGALEPILTVLAATPVWTGEVSLANREGTVLPMSLVALRHHPADDTTDSYSFVLHNLSRQKEAEAARLEQERRLLRLQKSESLGVLAGGIAHDFNNLLTAMLGNAGLARFDLPDDSPLHEPLGQIENAAQRAADLCQQMLAYAGRRPVAASEVDLNRLVDQTRRLFQATISPKIAVELDLDPEPVVVHAEHPQIQQVILNLVINAAEAIGDSPGRIAIRSARRHFAHGELLADFGTDRLPAGPYALFEVADSGKGIEPALRQRIFEPFFSTKATGHGLGLAAVHGIISAHLGAIAVDSVPGAGSTFRIILPLSSLEPGTVPAPSTEPWATTGLALVVDDEPPIQAVAAQLLKSFGFTTLIAADGVEAVALFRQYAPHLRIVLLDVIMPRMDGMETLREFQRINSSIPVVLMSGYVGDKSFDTLPDIKPAGFIGKPFSRDSLRLHLESVLGRS